MKSYRTFQGDRQVMSLCFVNSRKNQGIPGLIYNWFGDFFSDQECSCHAKLGDAHFEKELHRGGQYPLCSVTYFFHRT